jgi:16S rRNA (cytosine967-C5)-methyltransferase
MQSQDIDALSVLQSSILAAAAALVKPGGALVYATCSLLHRENEAVVEAFDAERLGFDAPQFLRLHPDEVDTDGFFAARWVRIRRPAVK